MPLPERDGAWVALPPNAHRTDERPNVILICVDQWRGDCLSILDHPDVQTPYLDQLAGCGAIATQAYSATPTCVPARMALMTGLTQETHRRVGYQDGVTFDVPLQETLPGAFREAGYQTQAIGKMHYWPERVRIGFDDVLLHDGYLHHSRGRTRDAAWFDDYLVWLRQQEGTSAVEDYIDNGIGCNSVVARPWDKAESLHPTNWVISQAERWLYRRDPTVPFFLYLSFHRPHAPYDPPQWAYDRYSTKELREPPVGDWEEEVLAGLERDWDPTSHVAHYRPRDVHQALAGYYGHMTHIDAQISRLMQVLGEFGQAENTYVAFVSDHGDMMGDHNLWRKGYPYEGSAHVPLLIAGPDVVPGTRIDEIVELRDVMPTLLGLAGVEIPDAVQGRDFSSLLRGQGSRPWRKYLHGEHHLFGQSIQWIRADNLMYVWWSGSGREQLFDLNRDPQQLHDCIDDKEYQDQHQCMRSYLIESLTQRPEGFVRGGDLVVGAQCSCVSEQATSPHDNAR
ncbi:arylsulfatase [Actinomyces vulturis]|uniref:arylsulfatase n=1 Tax=Actinomyces vulturis TaxID=1857645 RepID=UPI00082DA900|nr:arylsulfatase [Actinomyces vulturis]